MSLPEKLIWFRLRDQKFAPFHFCRRYGIGPYTLDFYSPPLRLGIEIAGEIFNPNATIHNKKMISRRQFFTAYGVSVLRLSNKQVYDQIDGILALLTQRCRKYLKQDAKQDSQQASRVRLASSKLP